MSPSSKLTPCLAHNPSRIHPILAPCDSCGRRTAWQREIKGQEVYECYECGRSRKLVKTYYKRKIKDQGCCLSARHRTGEAA